MCTAAKKDDWYFCTSWLGWLDSSQFSHCGHEPRQSQDQWLGARHTCSGCNNDCHNDRNCQGKLNQLNLVCYPLSSLQINSLCNINIIRCINRNRNVENLMKSFMQEQFILSQFRGKDHLYKFHHHSITSHWHIGTIVRKVWKLWIALDNYIIVDEWHRESCNYVRTVLIRSAACIDQRGSDVQALFLDHTII